MLPANWLTEVIKLAALVVLAATVYFVFWPRIKVLLGEKNADLRSIELATRYEDSLQNELEEFAFQGLQLRHIRAAMQGGEVVCLFVNDGASALNLRIETNGDADGTIQPDEYLPAGETGSIRLSASGLGVENDIHFTIRYEDERGNVHRDRYNFSSDEGLLRDRGDAFS